MTAIDDFSRVVASIYDAAVEPNNWTVALHEISSAVGATGCSIVLADRTRPEITVESVGADPANMIAYNDYFGRLDPISTALDRMPAGTVATHDDMVSRDVVPRSEFFNDWAHPSGYGDGIASVLTRDGGSTSWLSAGAAVGPDPFGTPERISLMRALVPHLQQAIRTQARLSDLDRRHRDFVAALDLLSDGVAMVGRDGRVIHLNPRAEAIIASSDGLCLRSGYLAANVVRTDDALGQVVRQAFSRGRSTIARGGCIAVPRPSGRRPYALRAVPLNPDGPVGVATQTVLIVIVDPELQPMPESEALRRLYGVTRNEAEVALRVLNGMGLAPIAEELSMSLATVRTHVQHVFDKTNTHRQAELVRLLLGGLAATRRLDAPQDRHPRER